MNPSLALVSQPALDPGGLVANYETAIAAVERCVAVADAVELANKAAAMI